MPLGSIGSGGMGRDYRGNIRRWTHQPGTIRQFVEPLNGFALWLRCGEQPAQAWPLQIMDAPDPDGWGGRVTVPGTVHYHALFPCAWMDYPVCAERPLDLRLEQFSPVITGNYNESAWPVACFVWNIHNTSKQSMEIALLGSFCNLNGTLNDTGNGRPLPAAGLGNRAVHEPDKLAGIVFERGQSTSMPEPNSGQMALIWKLEPDLISEQLACFDSIKDATDVWQQFTRTGHLPNQPGWTSDGSFPEQVRGFLAGAVTARCRLQAEESRQIVFALSWDWPIVRFPGGRRHWRRHTTDWGRQGDQALARHALLKHAT